MRCSDSQRKFSFVHLLGSFLRDRYVSPGFDSRPLSLTKPRANDRLVRVVRIDRRRHFTCLWQRCRRRPGFTVRVRSLVRTCNRLRRPTATRQRNPANLHTDGCLHLRVNFCCSGLSVCEERRTSWNHQADSSLLYARLSCIPLCHGLLVSYFVVRRVHRHAFCARLCRDLRSLRHRRRDLEWDPQRCSASG